MINLIDAHCHLDMLEGNLETYLQRAKDQGVVYCLSAGVTLQSFPNNLSIAIAHENVGCAVGVQPSETEPEEPTVEKLGELAKHPKVIGIGETGLDYHYCQTVTPEMQRLRFRNHIRAARMIQKPLIIHMREADQDILSIMQEEQAETVGGMMHCFTEDKEIAKHAMDLNFLISISGIVTFPKAAQVQEVAKYVPLDRLLIETDAPFLAPVPNRGKPNEPAYVRFVAEKIAELRGISLETLAEATTENFRRLFLNIQMNSKCHESWL